MIPYPNCYRCPFGRSEGYRLDGARFPNCASSCLTAIEDQIVQAIRQRPIGCIVVEPCQGRGGEVVPPLDFLRMLRQLCDTYKILLVFDEIYTGFNRTGALFASDQFGVYPDLLCLGKGLTTGFPMAACLVGQRSWTPGRVRPARRCTEAADEATVIITATLTRSAGQARHPRRAPGVSYF